MKIFISRKIPDIAISTLREAGYEIDISDKDAPLSKAELIAAIKAKPYDAVITLLTDKVDADVLSAAPNAKIFANYAVGFDNVDLKAAAEKNIYITNTPGALEQSVAEHVISLMLALAHSIVQGDQFMREGKYTGWDPMLFIGFDLSGLTLGIVGAGRIGERVATICKNGFGMNVIYYDVKHNENIEKSVGARFVDTVEGVLKEADVVSLHVPLIPSTMHLINAERLSMMKKNAILINTSRGPVIHEKALIEALQNKTISGAGLDVYEQEPQVDPALLALKNVVLTPHIASATKSARDMMASVAAKNVIAALSGQVPPNIAKI